MQVIQKMNAMEERIRNIADEFINLKKLMRDVYGAPVENIEEQEQDTKVLSDYCFKMFVKNFDTDREGVHKFTTDSRAHSNKLSTLMYRPARGPEIISTIEKLFKDKKK